MKVTKKEEEDMKRNRLLDKRITKKVRKFILYIKEMFYINANSKNLTTIETRPKTKSLMS